MSNPDGTGTGAGGLNLASPRAPGIRYEKCITPSPKSTRSDDVYSDATMFVVSHFQPSADVSGIVTGRSSDFRSAQSNSYGRRWDKERPARCNGTFPCSRTHFGATFFSAAGIGARSALVCHVPCHPSGNFTSAMSTGSSSFREMPGASMYVTSPPANAVGSPPAARKANIPRAAYFTRTPPDSSSPSIASPAKSGLPPFTRTAVPSTRCITPSESGRRLCVPPPKPVFASGVCFTDFIESRYAATSSTLGLENTLVAPETASALQQDSQAFISDSERL